MQQSLPKQENRMSTWRPFFSTSKKINLLIVLINRLFNSINHQLCLLANAWPKPIRLCTLVLDFSNQPGKEIGVGKLMVPNSFTIHASCGSSVLTVCSLGGLTHAVTGLLNQALVHVVNDASVSWNGITKSSTRSVPFVPVAVISIVRFAKKEPYMVAVRPSSKLRDAPQERITPESFRTVAGEAVTVLGSSRLLATRVARIAYHPIPRSRSAPRP